VLWEEKVRTCHSEAASWHWWVQLHPYWPDVYCSFFLQVLKDSFVGENSRTCMVGGVSCAFAHVWLNCLCLFRLPWSLLDLAVVSTRSTL